MAQAHRRHPRNLRGDRRRWRSSCPFRLVGRPLHLVLPRNAAARPADRSSTTASPPPGIFKWPAVELGPVFILPEVLAGIVILGINEGAYMAEIVRAGILAVDPGQTEAAKSLGMTYGQTMSRIVLPQAARVIIPPLGNEFNNMLKTTSLADRPRASSSCTTPSSVAAGTTYTHVRVLRRVRRLVPAPDDDLGLRPGPDRAAVRARAPTSSQRRPAQVPGSERVRSPVHVAERPR